MNERCWTLLGSRDSGSRTWRIGIHHVVLGEPARVEADWAWTLTREESHGDVMGFYHTHPPGFGAQPSQRDIRTMQAWCSALGKSLLCLIAEEPGPGIPTTYVFENDEHRGRSVGAPAQEEAGIYIVKESLRATEAE
jgi:proteasome lid subunit RPN8/RPN11